MGSRRLAWALLALLSLTCLPGCCMLGFGCCAFEVDLELADARAEEWMQSRITVVTVLLADAEKSWLEGFATRGQLAAWIADRDLTAEQEQIKEKLLAEGRLKKFELQTNLSGVQLTASLDPGEIEPNSGRLVVMVNYRGEDPETHPDQYQVIIPVTQECRYGVKIFADGSVNDTSKQARLR